MDGKSHEETSQIMGTSMSTVNNHIVKAIVSTHTYINPVITIMMGWLLTSK